MPRSRGCPCTSICRPSRANKLRSAPIARDTLHSESTVTDVPLQHRHNTATSKRALTLARLGPDAHRWRVCGRAPSGRARRRRPSCLPVAARRSGDDWRHDAAEQIDRQRQARVDVEAPRRTRSRSHAGHLCAPPMCSSSGRNTAATEGVCIM